VGVQVRASPLQRKAAARVGIFRNSSIIALPHSRGCTLARRLVDDPVIACRALIAAVVARCIQGCTHTNATGSPENAWTGPSARSLIGVRACSILCTCNSM
jgi:hypothetical protein